MEEEVLEEVWHQFSISHAQMNIPKPNVWNTGDRSAPGMDLKWVLKLSGWSKVLLVAQVAFKDCITVLNFDTAISLMHMVPHAKSMFSKLAGWHINTVESKFHLNDWLSKCPNHYMCSRPSSLCMQWSGQTPRSGGIITESAQTLIANTKTPIVLSLYVESVMATNIHLYENTAW